jgi:hypothetical protein
MTSRVAVEVFDPASTRAPAYKISGRTTHKPGDEKGSLKSETVKYGHETKETRTEERLRWRGPVAYTKDRPVLSSERAPAKTTIIVKRVMNIWS